MRARAMRVWGRSLRKRVKRALTSAGIGVFPIAGPRFGVNLFADLRKYAPGHDFRVIFDVGANVGEFALDAVGAFPAAMIYAFEPASSTFAELQRVTKRQPQISCSNLAIGEADEERSIALYPQSVFNRLVRDGDTAAMREASPQNFENVQVMRLDTFANRHAVESVDLLKTDTEGFEREVLRGAGPLLDRTTFILSEVALDSPGAVHVPFAEVVDILGSRGFRLVCTYDTFYYCNTTPDGYCDALFANRALLN